MKKIRRHFSEMMLPVSLLLFPAVFLGEPAGDAAARPRFLNINGGVTPTSNYSTFEDDIHAFTEGLFGGQVRLVSAGGPESLVVPIDRNGLFQRDATGHILQSRSTLRYPGILPANRTNVLNEIRRIGTDNLQSATLFFGDHGDSEGIGLWDGNHLSGEDLLTAHRQLPDNVVIRSIHSHCHAGRGMIDPARQVPRNAEELRQWFPRYYRSNSCAFGIGLDDELSYDYSFGVPWREGRWMQFFQATPHPTLQQFKDHLTGDNSVVSTPVLTSDYFIQDLSKYFCAQQNTAPPRPAAGAHLGEGTRAIDFSDPCQAMQADDVLPGAVVFHQRLHTNALELASTAASHYIEANFPQINERFFRAQNEIESIKAELVRLGHQGAATAGIERRLEILINSPSIREYERLQLSLSEGLKDEREFIAFIQGPQFGRWLNELPQRQRLQTAIGAFMRRRGNTIRQVMDPLTDRLRELQGERKQQISRLNARLTTFVMGRLNNSNDPNLRSIKEMYESIRRCETTPINQPTRPRVEGVSRTQP